jgi:hypothetical protein
MSLNPRYVHRLDDPAPGRTPQFYYACPACGWCGSLRITPGAATDDGERHIEAKATAKAA